MNLLKTVESISEIQNEIFEVEYQIIDLMKDKLNTASEDTRALSEFNLQIRDLKCKKDLLHVFLEQRKGLLKIFSKELV